MKYLPILLLVIGCASLGRDQTKGKVVADAQQDDSPLVSVMDADTNHDAAECRDAGKRQDAPVQRDAAECHDAHEYRDAKVEPDAANNCCCIHHRHEVEGEDYCSCQHDCDCDGSN